MRKTLTALAMVAENRIVPDMPLLPVSSHQPKKAGHPRVAGLRRHV
jgi:hypothetical protein